MAQTIQTGDTTLSGIQLGNLGQVQLSRPDVSGYANSGFNAQPFLQAFQAGQQIAGDKERLELQRQQLADQRPGMLMEQEMKKKAFLADAAYSISSLPEDQQKEAYNKTVMGFAQQGILRPEEIQAWDKGGKEAVSQLAAQSPLAGQAQKLKIEELKLNADLGLKAAQANYYEAKGEVARNPKLMAATKPLSADSAKVLEIASGGTGQIDELRNLYGNVTNPNISGLLPNAIQSEGVQKIEFLKQDLADRIGRLRSGGAINSGEEARFMQFLPKAGDSDSTVKFKLGKLQSAFDNVKDTIRPGAGPSESVSDPGFMEASKLYPGLTQEQYKAGLEYDSKNK